MEPFSYVLGTRLPASYTEKLLDFMHYRFLIQQQQRFGNIAKITSETGSTLSYNVLGSGGQTLLLLEVKASIPLEVKITPLVDQVSDTLMEEAKQDVVIALQLFEEEVKKTTLFFAWREGEKIVPEATNRGEKSLQRIFLETQVMLFILYSVVGIFLFTYIQAFFPNMVWMVPLVLVGSQLLLVIFSPEIIERAADWHITRENPTIHILKYILPTGSISYTREQLLQIKKAIFEEILSKNQDIDCESASRIFGKYGITCQPDSLLSMKVNIYDLVKNTADRFGFPMPRIIVSNTMMPNAAASGPSPNRGLVLITTGLLVKLDEAEIESVLGHEFGHLRGRDPLWLYSITSAEFLFRFYVLLPFFPFVYNPFLFLVYIWVSMGVIFFIAKFFEARSDLVSAIEIGKPKVLARALEKIGFQRLLYERTPSFRLRQWVGFDAHPPIYFRVRRLEKLTVPVNIKHPLVQSIKDVVSGFIATI
jgi:heat shock protein HtpX